MYFDTPDAEKLTFEYNADGIRTKKEYADIAGEVPVYTDVYTVDGSKILSEQRTDEETGNVIRTIYYVYDANGSVVGMKYNGVQYWYQKNMQGDVVRILNEGGAEVAIYTYDAWGKILQITDKDGNDVSGSPNHIANINPFRYRGYYYDVETGWYYLNARYYDPNVGRFLSPDAILITDRDVQGYNLYQYCYNNPIIYNDSDGYMPNKNTIPPQSSGYKPGKQGPTPGKTSNGVWGWADKYGNIWVPDTRDNAHGGIHWDITDSKGNYINVYPDGHTRYGKGKVHYKSDSFYPERNITFSPDEMLKDRRDSFITSPSIDRHTILSDHTITKPVENNEPNITVTDVAKPVAAGLSIFVGWKIVKTIIAITMVPATGGTSLIIAAATP